MSSRQRQVVLVERGGEYLLAHLRDDVCGKSGESMQGIVLYVRSEKLYALRKSYLNLHAIQRTGARSLSTSNAGGFAGPERCRFSSASGGSMFGLECRAMVFLLLNIKIPIMRAEIEELWTLDKHERW